jgi:hypothetical protein
MICKNHKLDVGINWDGIYIFVLEAHLLVNLNIPLGNKKDRIKITITQQKQLEEDMQDPLQSRLKVLNAP